MKSRRFASPRTLDTAPCRNHLITMRLIRRSRHGTDPVRHVSAGGDLFVACFVVGLILVALVDAFDPAMFVEAELEFTFLDFGADAAMLGASEWPLLRFLLMGSAAIALATAVTRGGRGPIRALRSAAANRPDKVPI